MRVCQHNTGFAKQKELTVNEVSNLQRRHKDAECLAKLNGKIEVLVSKCTYKTFVRQNFSSSLQT